MGTQETTKKPDHDEFDKIDEILEVIGLMFVTGTVGASAFHFIKGMYNSPPGVRLSSAAQAMRKYGPHYGGRVAIWGGMYITFRHALVQRRKKDDAWNSIISGAATSGLFAVMVRGRGLAASACSAAVGGASLAYLHGILLLSAKGAQQNEPLPSQILRQSVTERTFASESDSGASRLVWELV